MTAIAACATVSFSFAQYWSGAIRDKQAEFRTSELEAQTAIAKADVAKANSRIAEAQKEMVVLENETAKAKERTANLEKEAETAKLEQERIKQVVAWRIISPEALMVLAYKLTHGARGTINIAYPSGEPEALYLAVQISKAFNAAKGWTLASEARSYPDRLIFGVYIYGANAAVVETLKGAFHAAGIPYSDEQIPTPGLRMLPPPETDATIYIGSKTPPF